MTEDQARLLGEAVARVRPGHRSHAKGRRSPGGIKVAVATFPHAGADLSRELQLVKSALLYADEVTICSANSTLLSSLAAIANLSEEQKLQFIREVVPAIRPDLVDQVDVLRKFLANRTQGGDAFRLQLQARRGLEQAWKDVRAHVTRMLEAAGAAELEPAIEHRPVRIDFLYLQHSTRELPA